MPAWNDILVLAPMEITDGADEAFWVAMTEYEDLKHRNVFPRKTLPAFLWSAMMQALPQNEFAEQIEDFCSAVLAGNRPRVGEPFDTIYRWLKRAVNRDGKVTAENAGLNAAILFIEKRRDDYVREHGSYDPSTGVTEFPGDGEEYVGELEELIDGIRGLSKVDTHL